MIEFGLALVLVLLLITGMAIGVIMGRKPISGSCGGVAAALGEKEYTCDICGGDPNKCENQDDVTDEQNLAYDATEKTVDK
jgi:hypothetical protein